MMTAQIGADPTAEQTQLAARALAAAVRMLGQREHSESELRRKLARKLPELDAEQTETVISELIANGWLSDARFTETLIRSRANRGYGPHYITRELTAKGIDAALAADQLALQSYNWREVAADLVARRHPRADTSPQDWQRAARYLQRRGFAADIIARVLGDRPYPQTADD